jgi:hypothetical protein
MLNMNLLARPFSYDRPRVEGYRPLISGKITRIGRCRRNAWRAEALVDGTAMCTSHHDTKAAAERHLEGMIKAYAEAHYIQA